MHNQMQMESGVRGGHIQGNEAGVPKTVGGFSNELEVHRHQGMYGGSGERDRRSWRGWFVDGERRQGDRQLPPFSGGILSLTGWLGTPDKRR